MSVQDPVRRARELFEAHRGGDPAAGQALAPEQGDTEATAHRFEALSGEQVLVCGRLRVFRHGLRDSPAWWLLTWRAGRMEAARFATESAARAAALPLAA